MVVRRGLRRRRYQALESGTQGRRPLADAIRKPTDCKKPVVGGLVDRARSGQRRSVQSHTLFSGQANTLGSCPGASAGAHPLRSARPQSWGGARLLHRPAPCYVSDGGPRGGGSGDFRPSPKGAGRVADLGWRLVGEGGASASAARARLWQWLTRSRTGTSATSSAITIRSQSDRGICVPSVRGAPGDLEASGVLVPFIPGVGTSVQHPSHAHSTAPVAQTNPKRWPCSPTAGVLGQAPGPVNAASSASARP